MLQSNRLREDVHPHAVESSVSWYGQSHLQLVSGLMIRDHTLRKLIYICLFSRMVECMMHGACLATKISVWGVLRVGFAAASQNYPSRHLTHPPTGQTQEKRGGSIGYEMREGAILFVDTLQEGPDLSGYTTKGLKQDAVLDGHLTRPCRKRTKMFTTSEE